MTDNLLPSEWIAEMTKLGIRPNDEFFFLIRVLRESGVDLAIQHKIFIAALREAERLGDKFLERLGAKVSESGKSASDEITKASEKAAKNVHTAFFGDSKTPGALVRCVNELDNRLQKFSTENKNIGNMQRQAWQSAWALWAVNSLAVGLVSGLVFSILLHPYFARLWSILVVR